MQEEQEVEENNNNNNDNNDEDHNNDNNNDELESNDNNSSFMASSSFAAKMMGKMGHVAGQGLGREGQGMAQALEPVVILNRGGLGSSSVVVETSHEWQPRKVCLDPNVEWLECGLSQDELVQLPWEKLMPAENVVVAAAAAAVDTAGEEKRDAVEYKEEKREESKKEEESKEEGEIEEGEVDDNEEQNQDKGDKNGENKPAVDDHYNPPSYSHWTHGPVLDVPFKTVWMDENLITQVASAKTALDVLTDQRRFRESRARANPFEQIGNSVFQNRAALKMAEVDAIFQLLDDRHLIPEERGVLFFGDVCSGPGGFTEYMYWRRKWKAAGMGMTLKYCREDFKLHQCNPEAPVDGFWKTYGPSGTGDITIDANLRDFASKASDLTDGRGLSLMTGDGGFDVSQNFNSQEVLSRHIYLGQCLCALMSLRKGGNFVCKLFDCHTAFTAHLLYIMGLHFSKICLVKPCQSRPANSERYLVAMGLTVRSPPVIEYLLSVLNYNMDMAKHNQMIYYILPRNFWVKAEDAKNDDDEGEEAPGGCGVLITKDNEEEDKSQFRKFAAYLKDSNIRVAKEQVVALQDLRKYYEDSKLDPPADQQQIQEAAYSKWNLPVPGFSSFVKFDQHPSEWPGVQQCINTLSFRYSNADHYYGDGDDRPAVIVSGTLEFSILVSGFGPVGKQQRYQFGSFFYNSDGSLSYAWGVKLPRGTCLIGHRTRAKGNARLRDGNDPRQRDLFEVTDVLYLGCVDCSGDKYTTRIKNVQDFLYALHPCKDNCNVNIQLCRLSTCAELMQKSDTTMGRDDVALFVADVPITSEMPMFDKISGRGKRKYGAEEEVDAEESSGYNRNSSYNNRDYNRNNNNSSSSSSSRGNSNYRNDQPRRNNNYNNNSSNNNNNNYSQRNKNYNNSSSSGNYRSQRGNSYQSATAPPPPEPSYPPPNYQQPYQQPPNYQQQQQPQFYQQQPPPPPALPPYQQQQQQYHAYQQAAPPPPPEPSYPPPNYQYQQQQHAPVEPNYPPPNYQQQHAPVEPNYPPPNYQYQQQQPPPEPSYPPPNYQYQQQQQPPEPNYPPPNYQQQQQPPPFQYQQPPEPNYPPPNYQQQQQQQQSHQSQHHDFKRPRN